ncbi:MAG: penicillin-binding protein 1C [Desulfobacula sp. GWF2_41_7]|nr:MAG: penicillin-binding protein 1C [Desulfobacula sp. GWF2_41_7]
MILLLPWAFYRCVPFFCDTPVSFEEVRENYKASDALLFDRNGRVIHELRIDPNIRRLGWTNLDHISPSLIKSVIGSEDRRFYLHHGVDWKAAAHAGIQNILFSSTRGASTISMQLAALTDKRHVRKKGERALKLKQHQILQALLIERTWTKERILEAYLNLVSFRGEIQGIAAAALGLFDKMPSGLDETESLILASLIRSPNASSDDVVMRSCRLRDSLSYTSSDDAVRETVLKIFSAPYRIRPQIAIAPNVARKLLKTGSNVMSSLDGNLQQYVSESLKRQVAGLKDRNVHDGAVLVLVNQTGEILAYVGNSGDLSSAGHLDGVQALRQAGSTLKPFLYELAIEKKLLTAASVLMDSPIHVTTATGIYAPHNYSEDYKGAVSVRTCLSASLNIPAVRTILLAGVEAFASRLQELGFSRLTFGEFYGASLALGSADISLYELTNAYRTLANKGLWSPPALMPASLSAWEKPVEKRILDENAAFIISDILSDRGARSMTFGLENSLSTRFWTSVKTGTSKDMRDNWCVGYSEIYTVGVWVGNFNGEPMWNVSGMSGAAPVWLETMNYLHRNLPSLPPDPPGGVVETEIIYSDGLEPQRREWFIFGTETRLIEMDDTAIGTAKIIYPPDGTIFALDPDIPEGHQMIFFSATPGDSKWKWVLNDKIIAWKESPVRWKLKTGAYTLSLMDSSNSILDSVTFEVRGNGP